jgi:hypothetical protein
VGNGAEAEHAAQQIEARRQERLAAREARLEEHLRVAATLPDLSGHAHHGTIRGGGWSSSERANP